MNRYCLDTSSLINGWHKHYSVRVFPGVWESLELLLVQRRVFSCIEVWNELSVQRDDLFEWAKARKHRFEQPNSEILAELAVIMQAFPNFVAQGSAKNTADPWVIAHAKAEGGIVVSDEYSAPRQKPNKPPKIPDACAALGIRCVRLTDFFESYEIRFVRDKDYS